MSKSFWLITLALVMLAPLGSTQELEIFDKDNEMPTLKWQRVIGENLLREKIISALTPLAKDQRFNVYVAVRLKSIRGRQQANQDLEQRNPDETVDLGKLGTAAPAISDDVIAKGTLWAHVEYIKTEVVLYDYAPEEQIRLMDTITRKVVYAVVPNWRAGIQVIVPKFDLFNWIFDRKILIGVIVALLFTLATSVFLLLNFFYSKTLRTDDEKMSFVNVSPNMREWPSIGRRDEVPVRVVSLPAPDYARDVSASIPALDVNEWKKMIEHDPSIGAVLANIFPPEAAARIFSGLPVDLVQKTTAAALKMNQKDVQAKTAEIQKLLMSMAHHKSGESFLDHAVDLIGRVGPDREGVFFNALVHAERIDLLEQAARRHYPSELIPALPSDLLRLFVNVLRTEERIELALAVDKSYRTQVLEAIGEPGSKIREYVEMQIEVIQNDSNRIANIKARSPFIWWDFVKLVRKSINSDHELARRTDLFLTAWLSEQTQKMRKGGRGGQAA
jgi:hypothetical protein